MNDTNTSAINNNNSTPSKHGTVADLSSVDSINHAHDLISTPSQSQSKHHRTYCSFSFMFITAALLQLIVAIIIWFLGYQTSLNTVDTLSNAYRNEFMTHAVDKTNVVFSTPTATLAQVDFVMQRYLRYKTPIANLRDATFISDMTNILHNALPDLTSIGVCVTPNTMLFVQSHVSDIYAGLTYEFLDNETDANTLTYHYQTSIPLNYNNYSQANILKVTDYYQPEIVKTVTNYTASTRPWYQAAVNTVLGSNAWSVPYLIAGQTGQAGVVIANARAGSFSLDDAGAVDYVVSTTIRMYPVITNLLASIPIGENGRALLMTTDLQILALANSTYPITPNFLTIDNLSADSHAIVAASTPLIHEWRNRLNFSNLGATLPYMTAISIDGHASHLQISIVSPDNSLFLVLALITLDVEFDGGLENNIITTAVITAVLCVITICVICSMVVCLNRPVKRIVRFMSELAKSHQSDDDQTLKPKLHALHRKWMNTMDEPLLLSNTSRNTSDAQSYTPNNISSSVDVATHTTTQIDENIACSAINQSVIKSSYDSINDKLSTVLQRLAASVQPVTSRLQINELRILGDTFESMLLRLIESHDSVSLANDQKQQFMRFVFHEVRVPLNAITLGVEQLKDTSDLPIDVVEVCDILSEQAAAVTRILNDVLSIQRIEDNRLQLEFKQFNLNKFIIQTVQSFQAEFAKKQLNVTSRIDTQTIDIAHNGIRCKVDLNQQIECTYVLGDMYRLRQCFSNFVSNACKFVPINGNINVVVKHAINHTPPIKTLLQNTNIDTFDPYNEWCDVTVSVIDNGVGINNQDIHELFEPYRQINASELQQGKGSGLGLSISKRLIALHGGHVGCSSIPNEHTEFYFTVTLPMIQHVFSLSHNTDDHNTNDIDDEYNMHNTQLTLLPDIEHRVSSNRSNESRSRESSHTEYTLANRHTSQDRLLATQSRSSHRTLETLNTTLNTAHSMSSNKLQSISSITSPKRESSEILSNISTYNNGGTTQPSTYIINKQSDVNNTAAVLPSVSHPSIDQSKQHNVVPPIIPPIDPTNGNIQKQYKILVVEDSAPNRKLLISMLKRMNKQYVVDGAENGQLCVDLFKQNIIASNQLLSSSPSSPYDLVLMDGQMPVMNGFDATRELRSLHIAIPIVAVTGNALSEDIKLFMDAGVDDVLTKPLQIDKLRAVLQKFIH